jgi:hypothetical protein
MKLFRIFTCGLTVFLGYLTCWIVRKYHPGFVSFTLDYFVAFGTFGAVVYALFQEELMEWLLPIEVKILVPDSSNTVIDLNAYAGQIYHHHLIVKNLNPCRALKDCRVWLRKIEVQQLNGNWNEPAKFAVPQLMEWAPSEYSHDKRTFSKQQVFDFGITKQNNGGFELKTYREQHGNIPRQFKTGTKVRFTFYAAADNYLEEKEFCFEVDVLPTVHGQNVTPSKVTAVSANAD